MEAMRLTLRWDMYPLSSRLSSSTRYLVAPSLREVIWPLLLLWRRKNCSAGVLLLYVYTSSQLS